MPELNTRAFEVHEYHRMRPLRRAWFKAQAYEMAPGKWIVHVTADYMESKTNIDAGEDPLPTMLAAHKTWRNIR